MHHTDISEGILMGLWFQQMQTGESGRTDKIDSLLLISSLIRTFLQTNWQNYVYSRSPCASLFLLISSKIELVRAGMVLLVLSCGSAINYKQEKYLPELCSTAFPIFGISVGVQLRAAEEHRNE